MPFALIGIFCLHLFNVFSFFQPLERGGESPLADACRFLKVSPGRGLVVVKLDEYRKSRGAQRRVANLRFADSLLNPTRNPVRIRDHFQYFLEVRHGSNYIESNVYRQAFFAFYTAI